MNVEKVVVQNQLTGEVGEIRRAYFESPVFNPDGLLVEIEDTRGGCVDCGTAIDPEIIPVSVEDDEEYDLPDDEDN